MVQSQIQESGPVMDLSRIPFSYQYSWHQRIWSTGLSIMKAAEAVHFPSYCLSSIDKQVRSGIWNWLRRNFAISWMPGPAGEIRGQDV